MKTCTKCGLEQPLENFNKSSKNKDGKHSYCRVCQSGHYKDNKETHLANVTKNKSRYQKSARDIMVDAMSMGCVDCGNTDIRVLEFDHISGTKTRGVASMASRGWTLEKIKSEIAKCEVRCRNCHAIKTYERIGYTWHDEYAPVMAPPSKHEVHNG